MSQGGVQPVPEQSPGNMTQWTIKIARTVNLMLRGKINSLVGTKVTLRASQTTTTLTDERIGASSHLTFMPLTAHAATAAANLYVSALNQGSATLTHSSSANTDQDFRVSIIG